MTEPSQFGPFPGYEGVLVPEPVRGYSTGQGRATGRSLRLRSKPRFSLARRFARLFAGTEQLSTLGKIAFGSLWLLVFAMPWEDAITIPGFGTSVRLIGMVSCGLGALAKAVGQFRTACPSARQAPVQQPGDPSGFFR